MRIQFTNFVSPLVFSCFYIYWKKYDKKDVFSTKPDVLFSLWKIFSETQTYYLFYPLNSAKKSIAAPAGTMPELTFLLHLPPPFFPRWRAPHHACRHIRLPA